MVGASQDEGADEDDAESVDSDAPIKIKEGTYQIIGTMSKPDLPKPDWVKYLLDVRLGSFLIFAEFIFTK